MAQFSDYHHKSPRKPYVREGPPILYNPPGYEPPLPWQRTPSSPYSQPPFIPPFFSPPRQSREPPPPSKYDSRVDTRPAYIYYDGYMPRRPDLPPQLHSPQLNVLLQPPFSGKPPHLKFDLQAPLDSLALGGQGRKARISNTILSEPATEPGAEVMQLESDILPWPIIVHCFPGKFVTVGDVLNTLYGSLRYPISKSEEYLAKISKPENLDDAKAQAEHRVYKYRARENSQSADVRLLRVDWLLRNTIFHGLVPDNSRQTWKMRFVARPVSHWSKR